MATASSSASGSSVTQVGSGGASEPKNGKAADLSRSTTGSSRPIYGPEATRWSIPFISKPNVPEPPPSMDDRPLMPDLHAPWYSRLIFLYIQPLMLLGYRRPLEKSDLWQIDEARSSRVLADTFLAKLHKRKSDAKVWNDRLASGELRPSGVRRAWWTVRSKVGLGSKDGVRKVGLAGAISEVFFWRFWSAGGLKVVSDLLTVFSPLVTRYLINYGTDIYYAERGVPGYVAPHVANGYGAAVGLLCMIIVSSMCLHHFFYRSMSTGVLVRGMLIAAIYRRSLIMTGKARVAIPSSRLVNHISTDISRIDFCLGFFHMAWTAPVQFIVIVILLFIQIGPSSLVGVAILVIAIPIQGRFMGQIFAARRQAMTFSDKRAKLTQELLGNVKVLKLFAWEVPFLAKLNAIRASELKLIRRLLIIKTLNMSIALAIPVVATILAFAVYILTGNANSPAAIFTSLTLFNLLRMPLMVLPMSLGTIADARNALIRLQEVFDCETMDISLNVDPDAKFAISITDGNFSWEGAPPGELDAKASGRGGRGGKFGDKSGGRGAKAGSGPGRFAFLNRKRKEAPAVVEQKTPDDAEAVDMGGSVATAMAPEAVVEGVEEKKVDEVKIEEHATLSNIHLNILPGQLCAVVGPVGSGKSSLIQAMIGEMKRTSGNVTFGGSIGYCAQVAWIMNATVKENILFGRPFDAARYASVIHDACLEADLAMLPHGDATQIGEKGITLSGGQRQRVNIARALYFDSDIVCLDDPLSAVDAHVGKHLFEHAICGALKGKTRILVTHALHFLKNSEVDYIICMERGQITERGTYAELIAREGPFSRLMAEFGGGDDQADEEEQAVAPAPKEDAPETVKPEGKHVLMQEEERTRGSAGWPTWKAFLKAGHGGIWLPILIVALFLNQTVTVLSAYTLVWWQRDEFNQSTGFYIGLYAAFGILVGVFMFGVGMAALLMGIRVSSTAHRRAAKAVIAAPVSFFDTTPLGRIMSRFTKDLDTLDNNLNDSARMAINTLGSVVGSIVLIAIVQQYFLIAVFILLFGYWGASKFYRSSAREVKRLDNLLRSQLYAQFSESLTGLASIRAFGESDRFVKENERLIDFENRAYYLTVVNQRWLGMRLDVCGAFLVFVVAIISVAQADKLNPSQIGLALSYIISVQAAFSWVVRQTAEVENDINSFERINFYAEKLEQERPAEIEATTPPKSWPAQGEIVLDKVEMAYRPGLPLVLKGLSLHVKGGESLGIVGRTGAGKSSIMVALFRLVELSSGSIKIDGLDISTLGLADLRRKLAIIPQDALLFEGTLRSNLDPFNMHSDAELWDALRRSYLVEKPALPTVAEEKEVNPARASRFTLDMAITDGGENCSVGERSLISLARALVRNAQVVLLDEATASVDFATDAKIQMTIASEFRSKTLITIAHRLVTIISYDRVLVMSDGGIAELDTPENLYGNVSGIFRTMCDRSNIGLEDIRKSQAARRAGSAPPPELLQRATSMASSSGEVNPM